MTDLNIEGKKRFKTPAIPDPIKYLSLKEASSYLKVSIQTVHYLKNSGKIQFYKMGRGIFFEIEDLRKYLNSINYNAAFCHTDNTWKDFKTKKLLSFKTNLKYKIVDENDIWITLFNKKKDNSIRLSKREFRKYFTVEKI